MIDREHDLSITKQAEVLKISRGSVYYLPRPVSAADLAIMRHLDQLHLEFPFAGSRMLRGLLALQGCKIGRRHVKTLMRRMGIEALYRRPRTTRPEPGHKIYPYLLRGIEITRPNQVWAMDITYIPMARGFVYLAVVLDWATRRVLSWRLSITMEAAWCVETLEDALTRHGKPEIFNTDQGSQFTGTAFTGLLAGNGIAISMDGKGAWRDNVFVERLWRSVKYEEVYLRAYQSVVSGLLTAPCGHIDKSAEVDRFEEIGSHIWSTIYLTLRERAAALRSGLELAADVVGARKQKAGSSRNPMPRARLFRRLRVGTRSVPSICLPGARRHEQGCLRYPLRRGRCSCP